eukprot:scaffold593_cov382-Prasinococcus_capsulatus_cf.AAC.9
MLVMSTECLIAGSAGHWGCDPSKYLMRCSYIAFVWRYNRRSTIKVLTNTVIMCSARTSSFLAIFAIVNWSKSPLFVASRSASPWKLTGTMIPIINTPRMPLI